MANNTLILSDVHGKYGQMHQTLEESDWDNVFQLGDLGLSYRELRRYNPAHFQFVPGNHDNYDICLDSPYCAGDYGPAPFIEDSFFIRGGYSIDKAYHQVKDTIFQEKSWWPEEELNLAQSQSAYAAYCQARPKIMFSHTCPTEIARLVGTPSILAQFGLDPKTYSSHTQTLLQKCFEFHQPELWVFGHFHVNSDLLIKGTRFICLEELGYVTLSSEGLVI